MSDISPCRRYPSANDAVCVASASQQYSEAFYIAMFVAGMFKNKIKRRKASDVNAEVESAFYKKSIDGPRSKASRTSIADQPTQTIDTTVEKVMPPSSHHLQDAASSLTRNIDLEAESPDYQNRRTELLESEKKQAWYAAAKASASPAEHRASEIIFKIREHERVTHFGNLPGEAIPSLETRDMGGRFLRSKDHIDESKIFAIATHMPKGSHLHLHFNAELPPEVLLPHTRSGIVSDTMFIRSTCPLTSPEAFNTAEIVFNVMPKDTPAGNLYHSDYQPDWKTPDTRAWMRWADFRQQFPSDVRIYERDIADLDDAECWVREKMIITQESNYDPAQTANGAWACFNIGTRAFKGLLGYESIYRWYIGHAIDSLIHDHIMYAELRPMLLDKTITSDDGLRQLDHAAQMTIICEEVRAKQAALRAASPTSSIDAFPFGLKIIYSTPRSIPRTRMRTELQDCINLKLQFPDLICGFDLVGAEDRPNHIGFYADLLVAFMNTCADLHISIPFLFHAGESLLDTGGSHNPSNSNLYDALLLNAKRIGHGYSLLKHPLLVDKYKANNICLELCPISNELLHLCTNARQHIFPELLAAGLHCSLNADNPSLSNGPRNHSSSLSYEFYQVMVGDTRMTLHGWKQLAHWSLDHSCLSPADLQTAHAIFAREWERFCKYVVDEYADFADGIQGLEYDL